MNLGAPELLIILAVILLLFGATKLPKLARSLGEAQREFKQGMSEGDAPPAPTQPAPAEPAAAADATRPEPAPGPAEAPTGGTPDEEPGAGPVEPG